jgi:hypothetical protein
MKELTGKQIGNKMYRQRCLEYSKDAYRCLGCFYVSGNRSRSSGYEQCKIKDTCFFYINRDNNWGEIHVTFGSVIDFRKCNYRQLDEIKI